MIERGSIFWDEIDYIEMRLFFNDTSRNLNQIWQCDDKTVYNGSQETAIILLYWKECGADVRVDILWLIAIREIQNSKDLSNWTLGVSLVDALR